MIFFYLVENNRMLDEEKWLLIAIFSIKSWGQYCGVRAAKITIYTSQSYKPANFISKIILRFPVLSSLETLQICGKINGIIFKQSGFLGDHFKLKYCGKRKKCSLTLSWVEHYFITIWLGGKVHTDLQHVYY